MGANTNPWREEEIEILRLNRHLKVPELMALLPGRKYEAIQSARRRTGLKYLAKGRSADRAARAAAPEPAPVAPAGRAVGQTFITSSGVKAMMLPSGPVPYLHCLYGED